MAHSIGKTIAELRKSKGWTQVELAEKLNVSDKAVSKWESEGGFPEITQLPVIASIFDVSIDYLMTGKRDDSISLDDMDATKRMFYLIERDDVENYFKYGYEKETYFNDFPIHQNTGTDTPILAIIKHNSFKIFNACVKAGIRTKSCYARTHLASVLYATLDYFDILVLFACLAGSVDFLEQINFRSFAISDKIINNNRSNITRLQTYEESTAYLIKKKTIETIFTNENVPANVINYICTYVPFDSKKIKYGSSVADYGRIEGQFYFIEQVIIEQLYRSKRYDLLNKYLQSIAEDSLKTIKLFNDSDRRGEGTRVKYSITSSSYLIRTDSDSYGYTTVKGKVITISPKIIHLAISNLDEEYASKFIEYNKILSKELTIFDFAPFVPSETELKELFEITKREKRILSIKNNISISEHERRCKLASENALSLEDVVIADDYEAFVLLDETERVKLDPELLSRNGAQDVRFYIYAVNVNDNIEKLNAGLKIILEKYPKRYDIQDVLLSAGAIIDANIAMTNILKQNVLILNNQTNSDNSDIEVIESVTKQQLLKKIESNQLQYVIVNATIQMERRLKVHIAEQGVDLAEMIDKALSIGIIDEFNCKLLHKLRMARNSIMHAGNKSHYTTEVVKMWVEAVYSIN